MKSVRGDHMLRLFPLTVILAIAAAAPALAASDRDRTICFSLGNDDYKFDDKIEPSIRACTRMIESGDFKDRYLASIYRSRASWKEKKGAYDAALEDYNVSIRMEPDNVEGYDYRADVYQDLGDLDKALADYGRATEIDPKYASAYYSRGRIYEKKGEIERARAEYNATLALPTRNRIAKWAQDNARKRLDELDEARSRNRGDDRTQSREDEPRSRADGDKGGSGAR